MENQGFFNAINSLKEPPVRFGIFFILCHIKINKMNGQGTITFQNGDQYTGGFNNGAFNGKGTFQSKEGWTYEGDFVNGQAEGKGKLTTEQEVVYEGTFKQGVFQQK